MAGGGGVGDASPMDGVWRARSKSGRWWTATDGPQPADDEKWRRWLRQTRMRTALPAVLGGALRRPPVVRSLGQPRTDGEAWRVEGGAQAGGGTDRGSSRAAASRCVRDSVWGRGRAPTDAKPTTSQPGPGDDSPQTHAHRAQSLAARIPDLLVFSSIDGHHPHPLLARPHTHTHPSPQAPPPRPSARHRPPCPRPTTTPTTTSRPSS